MDISLRDYFAAKAIEGILQNGNRIAPPVAYPHTNTRRDELVVLARDAYAVADALLDYCRQEREQLEGAKKGP